MSAELLISEYFPLFSLQVLVGHRFDHYGKQGVEPEVTKRIETN